MKKILFVFLLFFSFSALVFAGCVTGFACSISELQQKEKLQLKKDIEVFKKSLNKDLSYKNFLVMKKNDISYNDLFLFNTTF